MNKVITATLGMILGLITVAYAATLTLTWTAPSDDNGKGGIIASYKLVYSTSPITEMNFNNATVIPTGIPKAPGQKETYTVNLTTDNHYYFAIEGVNTANNYAPMSNLAGKDFLAPSQVTDLSVQ